VSARSGRLAWSLLGGSCRTRQEVRPGDRRTPGNELVRRSTGPGRVRYCAEYRHKYCNCTVPLGKSVLDGQCCMYVQLCRCWSFTVLPIDLGLSNPPSVLLLLNSGSFPASQHPLPSPAPGPPVIYLDPSATGAGGGARGRKVEVSPAAAVRKISLSGLVLLLAAAAAVPGGPESTIQTARETDTWVEPGSWRLARPFSFSTISTLEVTESQC
jgi:hypothetical protein